MSEYHHPHGDGTQPFDIGTERTIVGRSSGFQS